MTVEQAKHLSEDTLGMLAQSLKQGSSEALKKYLLVMSRFHRYSSGNTLLILSQRPDAQHVAGLRSWLKLGRHVRKGEKGIVILAPMIGGTPSNDEGVTDESEPRLVGFRTAYLFDVSQTEGDPLPEFATVRGEPGPYTESLKAFVTEKQINLTYSEAIRPAHGTSSGGTITLLPGMSPAEEFVVLVHEVAHELLHRSERRKDTDRRIRETEAEAVAFVVAHNIGLDTNTASSDYIRLYSGDAATLAESLEWIQQAATQILQSLIE